MATLSLEELQQKLVKHCNWGALPRDLLTGVKSTAAGADDTALLAAFQHHLTTLVPFEWSVVQHAVFDAGHDSSRDTSSSSSRRVRAMMHAPAAGTLEGIMCFGGVQLGMLQEVKVQNEVSWIKDIQPAGLAPDCSRVYQGTPAYYSRQVVQLGPVSSKPGADWAAAPVSPLLDMGVLGHSVAVYGSRAFLFGGAQDQAQAAAESADILKEQGKCNRTTNRLVAYALDEAGTQGGLLPVLSEVPQLGAVPGRRMCHSAAVDPERGVMYIYGGVQLVQQQKDTARLPADREPGLLHAFDFATYTWSTIHTTGDHKPCSTTLLAFFWHAGALWAIPDLPRLNLDSHKISKLLAAGYQLLRLPLDTLQWQRVKCQGQAPSARTDCCTVFNPLSQELVVYGGRLIQPPFGLLADVHILSLPDTTREQQQQQQQQLPQQQQQQQPSQQQQRQQPLQQPVWKQVQPARVTLQHTASSGPQPQHLQSMLPLAGHSGGVVGSTGEVVFVGGYRRNDIKEPQPLLQVLTRAVKPPTPDTAKLAAVIPQQQMAMQHMRMQLARMVKQAHPAQVLIKPDGAGVRLPARLLALYSSLFDDLFQSMLEDQEDEEQQQQQQAQQPPVVPVPGVQQDVVAAVCRWMMGLLALKSCSVATLVDMYRVSDRLVMEQLMVEVLEELAARELLPQEAALVMRLASDFPGAGTDMGRSAAQQLQQQVNPATAPSIMALARQQNNAALQDRCVEVMSAHRKNDVYAVLDFAIRFGLRSLQGSCLGSIWRASRGQLVHRAGQVMQVVQRHLLPGQDHSRVPTVQMLERDLLNDLQEAEVSSLCRYVAVAERLYLRTLWEGLVDYCSRDEVWQLLHQPEHKGTLQQLKQRHVRFHKAVVEQRGGGSVARDAATADAAAHLLGRPVELS